MGENLHQRKPEERLWQRPRAEQECLEIPGVRMKAPGMEENLPTPAEAAVDLILIIHRKGNFYIQVEL